MTIEELLNALTNSPETVAFGDVIAVIDACYDFTPVSFCNGNLFNEAGQNTGSCKIFAFARLHDLGEEETLHCFGNYYREDVLKHPENDDHMNIRNFISSGWPGVKFNAEPLKKKQGV